MKTISNIYTILTIITFLLGLIGLALNTEAQEYDQVCYENFGGPVTDAIFLEELEEAKRLIESADYDEINCIDESNWTALTWAVVQGHTEIIELLIVKGAEVNVKDDLGISILDFAKSEKRARSEQLTENPDNADLLNEIENYENIIAILITNGAECSLIC